MRYTYFPGCSLKAGSIGYDTSTRAVCEALGIELVELDDWNCCGATSYTSITELEGFSISARNLALAEQLGGEVVAPCSACYTTMRKTNKYLQQYPSVREKVSKALNAGGLTYGAGVKVRHLAEILTGGPEFYDMLASKSKVRLEGLKVACYHGCQMVRPENGFDDPEYPKSLDLLMTALGAEPVPYPLTARCCGGSMIVSRREIALHHIHRLLWCAEENGAQCIAVACPLCHLVLDAYQGMARKRFKATYRLPILYFPQIMGVALGFKYKELDIDRNLNSAQKVLAPYLS